MADYPSWSAGSVKRGPGLFAGVIAVVGFLGVGLGALVVFDLLQSSLGFGAFVFAGVLAVVPLAIVITGIRWLDTWEPEPPAATWFALGFGGAIAVLLALVVDSALTGGAVVDPDQDLFIRAAVQAPVVEEIGKGLAVLLLFWWGRRRFDGPVDGVVYAAWTAAGFAFTENILYFGSALLTGGGEIAQTFFVRGVLSPFAHLMFTAFIGYSLGKAAERGARGLGLGAFAVGLIPAIALHALWNGALFFVTSFYTYFLLVQVPLFALVVLWVTWLRRQKGAVLQLHLAHYARLGYLHDSELAFLTSAGARRQARRWARSRGITAAFDTFVRDCARLALDRQAVARGLTPSAPDWEGQGLARLAQAREHMRRGMSGPA